MKGNAVTSGKFESGKFVVIFMGKYLSAKDDGSAVEVVVVLHEKNAVWGVGQGLVVDRWTTHF